MVSVATLTAGMDAGKAEDGSLDISFADKAFLHDPWTPLQRLQREARIFFSEKQQGWIISRHEDVRAAYTDRRLSASRTNLWLRGMPQDVVDRVTAMRMFNTLNVNRLDGRDHMRTRTLLMKAFDANTIRYVDSFLGEIVNSVLDDCEARGEFDFVKVVSAVLPAWVTQRLLGLPDSYRSVIFEFASEYIATSTAAKLTPEILLQLDAVIRRTNDMFTDLIAEREQHLGDDIFSRLVHARDGLNRLSHDELLVNLNGLIVGAAETTANTLATQVVEIARRPNLVETLRNQPERAIDIVSELLRLPGTIRCFTRQALEDIEMHGQTIRRGDLVYIMNTAANVDPTVFPNPLEVDIDRPNLRDLMTFSTGFHFCIGHMLAKTMLVTFFREAFRRFDIEILQDPIEPVSSFIFFGYREVKVRFTPRKDRQDV
ncbi:Cytochrome P450 [Sphingobium faniae]|nr:Cytochrome P450 [Sphingobium faniae]